MAEEEVGSLRAELVADAKDFIGGLNDGRKAVAAFAKDVEARFAAMADSIQSAGTKMTIGLTAPFAALAIISGNAAGSLEAAMNRIDSALGKATPDQLEKLSAAAEKLGPAVGRSALEAADGIESLALAGLSAEAILGGALDATLTLAAANNAELAPAAALTTDIMAQFAKTSSQLPPIVDKITGSLDSSKFGFIDYQQAVAQAGGVAGATGVSFEDFNIAIAATSTQFSSGATAGTSFKSFLSSLIPKSKEAEHVMAVLAKRIGEQGDLFYKANGDMKGMADIAQVLRDSLGGLSEKSRGEALTKLFGADGAQTAIGLMQQGREGIERLQAQINEGSAENKLATQMQGLEAATRKLGASFDALKIAIGKAGVIQVMTVAANAVASFTQSLAELPPWVITTGLVIGGLVAAMGPLLVIMTTAASVALPFLLVQFGLLATVLGALINPMGTVIALMGGLLVRAALTAAASVLGLSASFVALAGPIGLIVVVLGLAAVAYMQGAQASAVFSRALDESRAKMAAAKEQVLALAFAQGKLKETTLAATKAMRAQAVVKIKGEQWDNLREARKAYDKAKADFERADKAPQVSGPITSFGMAGKAAKATLNQAEADLRAASEIAQNTGEEIRMLDAAIADAESLMGKDTLPPMPKADPKAKAEKTGRERTVEDIRLQAELEAARLRGDEAEIRRLEDKVALKRQIADYESADLSTAAARLAAERDMADIAKARAEADARNLNDQDLAHRIQVAETAEHLQQAKLLRDEEDLKARIRSLMADNLSLEQATTRAMREQAELRAAEEEIRQRWIEDDARDREIKLAELRGDSEERIRALKREQEIIRRARELEREEQLDPESALAKATAESLEEEAARIQGVFRDTIKGGFRAALDGNFGSWFENWWKDRVAKGMENALNSLADWLQKILSQVSASGDGGGGGGLGSLIGSVGKIFGSGFGTPGINPNAPSAGTWGTTAGGGISMISAPKLANGGTISIGGRGGIDRNVLSVNGIPTANVSRGERIRVDPNEPDRGRGSPVSFDLRGAVMTADLVAQMNQIGAQAQQGAVVQTESRATKRGQRRLGR